MEALSDLKGCNGKVLMVGVNYDKETKEHTDETTVKTRTYSEKELHTVCGSFYVV